MIMVNVDILFLFKQKTAYDVRISDWSSDVCSSVLDVLRDWAVGVRLHEDPNGFSALDLGVPASAKIARGVEFAGRFALEFTDDDSQWLALLERLSVEGSHSTWRRQALLAIVRSELSASLLERCSAALLALRSEEHTSELQSLMRI